jgi:hypothetical protein
MLVTFKSKAAAEVMMYEHHAKRILDLLDKDLKRGIITPEETASAIAKLEAEIAECKAHPISDEVLQDVDAHHGDDHEHEQSEPVTFATRAYPLLEMLRAAHRTGNNVMWGV